MLIPLLCFNMQMSSVTLGSGLWEVGPTALHLTCAALCAASVSKGVLGLQIFLKKWKGGVSHSTICGFSIG